MVNCKLSMVTISWDCHMPVSRMLFPLIKIFHASLVIQRLHLSLTWLFLLSCIVVYTKSNKYKNTTTTKYRTHLHSILALYVMLSDIREIFYFLTMLES